jgi:hypothetical protein
MKVIVIGKHLMKLGTLVLISLHGKHHVVKRRTPGNDLMSIDDQDGQGERRGVSPMP